MSRLLFAAARGARIQYPKPDGSGWQTFVMNVPIENNSDCRIHPDDSHLQYGPISSALRAQAEVASDVVVAMGMVHSSVFWQTTSTLPKNELHRSLFLLFLAEALADEGM